MWFALAISAAALWGVTYALSERLLRTVSVPVLLLLSSLTSTLVMLAIAGTSGRLAKDLRALASSRELLGLLAAVILTYILANLAISYSIVGRNATVAAFIEIAYPLFTALAVWLFFKENQLNAATLAGGALIFAGAVIISVLSK
jgi:drug/metabolite transporter (DMT)-like permease